LKENKSSNEFDILEGKLSLDKINILYLDDDENVLQSYRHMFRFDYNIFATTEVKEAIEIIQKNEIHVIVSDHHMPNITGVEFFATIIDEYPEPIRILLTGFSNFNSITDSSNFNNIYWYITKPFTSKEMKLIIKNAAELYFLKKQLRRLLSDQPSVNEQSDTIRENVE